MTVVYLDRVVLLNLAVDYLLLLATARLAGLPLRRGRLALAAALGALYAAAVFLPGCRMLAHPACRLAAGVAVCRLAWRRERRPWRLTALFFLLSGALAGLLLAAGLAAGSPGAILSRVYYADISWPVLLGSAIGFGLLLHLVFRQGARHEGGELMDVTVSLQGRRLRLRALHDTGNTLRDPVSGQPVLVLEQGALGELWPPQAAEIIASGEAEYMRILSEAYNDPEKADFYLFLRSLDAAKLTMTGNNKTLIIDETSPIAQLFY